MIEAILTFIFGPKCRRSGCPLRMCPWDMAERAKEQRALHGIYD